MKKHLVTLISAAFLGVGGTAIAGDYSGSRDVGRSEYLNSCALCHGQDGKGSGYVIDVLKTAPPDLTTIKKRNGGVFPVERIYDMIDGREIVKGHGDRDMPAWGNRYSQDRVKAAEYYFDVPYDMDMYIRGRILALVDYLNRIQRK
jgi:mono/diheme cytochrome c family protein